MLVPGTESTEVTPLQGAHPQCPRTATRAPAGCVTHLSALGLMSWGQGQLGPTFKSCLVSS